MQLHARVLHARARSLLEVRGLAAANGVSGHRPASCARARSSGSRGLVGAGRTRGRARDLRRRPRDRGRGADPRAEPRHGGPDRRRAHARGADPREPQAGGARADPHGRATTSCSRASRGSFRARWFSPGTAARTAQDNIEQLRIATPSARQEVQFLSGGNQQKVVVGKWLNAEARLFIFDEPTRGIDVGAKAEIFALIDQLVKDGAGGADDQLRARRDGEGLRPRLRDARAPHRRRARRAAS